MVVDIEVLVKEAYESSKLKVEAERKIRRSRRTETKSSPRKRRSGPMQRLENDTSVLRERVRSEPPSVMIWQDSNP